jgi:hypothetical protein
MNLNKVSSFFITETKTKILNNFLIFFLKRTRTWQLNQKVNWKLTAGFGWVTQNLDQISYKKNWTQN